MVVTTDHQSGFQWVANSGFSFYHIWMQWGHEICEPSWGLWHCWLLQLKSESMRGASSCPDFIGNWLWLLVACDSLINLGDKFFYLVLVQLSETRTLGESKILSFYSLCWSREFRREVSHKISLPMSEVVWFSSYGVIVMIKLMMVGFCSIRGLCYSRWWVSDFRTLTQFQRSEMSLGLF